MTTLRQRVYKSIKEDPRDITDLIRSCALFIPEDHHLSAVTTSCLESLRFSPPENHVWILGQFIKSFALAFSDDQVLTGPWWVRVICILISGGSHESDELITNLDCHYSPLANAHHSLN